MSYKIVQIRFAGYPFYEVYKDDNKLACFPTKKQAGQYIEGMENSR